jgi:hypothetical protein
MSTGYWPCTALPLLPGRDAGAGRLRTCSCRTFVSLTPEFGFGGRSQKTAKKVNLASWRLQNGVCANSSIALRCWAQRNPHHYLLPMNLRKSRHWSKKTKQKWDVTMPMVTWVKSWRKLVTACKMPGFRFHDLRHTFRTQGAEAGVPLEVMMAQLGHMDRHTSLEYVHIQQRAFERAKDLIELEQAEILAVAKGHAKGDLMRTTKANPSLLGRNAPG